MELVSVAAPEVKTHRILRVACLVVLLSAAPVWESIRTNSLLNPDIWWHLRAGLWILQNHSVPRTGLFSQLSSTPWNDTSWLFDTLLALNYKVFGLRAGVLVLMRLGLAFAVITYLLARKSGTRFWIAVVLSAIAQFVVPPLQPAPSSVSILFFAIEMLMIVHVRRSGNWRPMFWLLPLFALWANVDVQVVSGLALLGFFVLASVCENAARRSQLAFLKNQYPPASSAQLGAVLGGSALCVLLSPYSFHVFSDFGETLYSSVGFRYFAEMHSMAFRSPQEYLLMLLIMTAFLALGRRRSLEIFEISFLIAATLLAFRIQRDAWIAALAAVTIISRGFKSEASNAENRAISRSLSISTAAVVGVVFLITSFRIPTNPTLLTKISKDYPVQACDFIARNHLPQPVFNTYLWGGFLTWYLPDYPAAIDGRISLYGDENLARYFDLIGGKARLENDPAFASAQTVLLERPSGMAKAFTNIPALSSRYKWVYRDDIAAVFLRQ